MTVISVNSIINDPEKDETCTMSFIKVEETHKIIKIKFENI